LLHLPAIIHQRRKIVPQHRPETEWLYYDGQCALCHRVVRFVLAVEPRGGTFRFAPLRGQQFQAQVPVAMRQSIGDSLVVRRADGVLLHRSAAVIHILRKIGGFWRLPAGILSLIPAFVRDAAYNAVARVRHRFFARPVDLCPAVPPELRGRFDQ
jgi:predicted DCC family thiol-disulfide oxidoreductase YuxK